MKASGFVKVTRASLQIKDRTIMPPDRTLFNYFQLQPDGTVKKVQGVWGDYLRDVDMKIVVIQHAPLNSKENTEHAMLITDIVQEGIPDPFFIPDPMLPY
jgi:hypothetical protein